jgi:hypothetical protein
MRKINVAFPHFYEDVHIGSGDPSYPWHLGIPSTQLRGTLWTGMNFHVIFIRRFENDF